MSAQMKSIAEISRADLKEYEAKKKLKALKKRLKRNSKKAIESGSSQSLHSAIELLYCVYKNEKQ